jgi:hypothetical protein
MSESDNRENIKTEIKGVERSLQTGLENPELLKTVSSDTKTYISRPAPNKDADATKLQRLWDTTGISKFTTYMKNKVKDTFADNNALANKEPSDVKNFFLSPLDTANDNRLKEFLAQHKLDFIPFEHYDNELNPLNENTLVIPEEIKTILKAKREFMITFNSSIADMSKVINAKTTEDAQVLMTSNPDLIKIKTLNLDITPKIEDKLMAVNNIIKPDYLKAVSNKFYDTPSTRGKPYTIDQMQGGFQINTYGGKTPKRLKKRNSRTKKTRAKRM